MNNNTRCVNTRNKYCFNNGINNKGPGQSIQMPALEFSNQRERKIEKCDTPQSRDYRLKFTRKNCKNNVDKHEMA